MVTGYGPIERTLRVWLPVAFFLVVALLPFYWMAIASLKPNSELYSASTRKNPTGSHSRSACAKGRSPVTISRAADRS